MGTSQVLPSGGGLLKSQTTLFWPEPAVCPGFLYSAIRQNSVRPPESNFQRRLTFKEPVDLISPVLPVLLIISLVPDQGALDVALRWHGTESKSCKRRAIILVRRRDMEECNQMGVLRELAASAGSIIFSHTAKKSTCMHPSSTKILFNQVSCIVINATCVEFLIFLLIARGCNLILPSCERN